MRVRCYDCGSEQELSIEDWRCACAGAWEPADLPAFSPKFIDQMDHSIWRYGELLGIDVIKPTVRMGVGWTPLVPARFYDHNVYFKLEYLSPSGSFKDRGVNTMLNQLVHMGVNRVVEDSSGNAGASLAAHAARFGINATIFVPQSTSPAKKHQIAVYGSEIRALAGSRRDVEEAAQNEVNTEKAYASHAYHPAYLAGQITAAYEIWEQLGGIVPDWIICPVAQGGLFLGFWLGYQQLARTGLVNKIPGLVAVQSERVAPLYQAWKKGWDRVLLIEPLGETIAKGVAVLKPARGKRLLEALRFSDGLALTVSEDEIISAQDDLAHAGYYVEPTSALVAAGLKQLQSVIKPEEVVVMPLTGSGLKVNPNNCL